MMALVPRPAHGRMGFSEPDARLELLCRARVCRRRRDPITLQVRRLWYIGVAEVGFEAGRVEADVVPEMRKQEDEDSERERVHVERRAAEPQQPAVDLFVDLRVQILQIGVLVDVDFWREEGCIRIQAGRVVLLVPAVEDEEDVGDLRAHACLAHAVSLTDMVRQGASVVVHDIPEGAFCADLCQHAAHLPQRLAVRDHHDVRDSSTRQHSAHRA